jgi:tetratricopeptide (TPR) repeat protein
VFAKQGNLEKAISHFIKVIELNPRNDKAHHNLAQTFFSKGEIGSAVTHYRESLRLMPDSPATLNGLSWILATSEKDEFRDVREAVRLAERACEITGYKNPETLYTLAAGYASTGRFADAVEVAQKAIDLYILSGNERLAKETTRVQRLYKAGQPYRASQ